MKKLFPVVAFAAVLVLAGCALFEKLPDINGCHWVRSPIGAELYDSGGTEMASFVSSGPAAAQVCVFNVDTPCQYRETDAQALAWLKKFADDGGIKP